MNESLYKKAFVQNVSGFVSKIILVKLAFCADDEGVFCLSYPEIANTCEISTRTAIRHINELEQEGFIARDYPGGSTPNTFKLLLDNWSGDAE